MKKVAGCEVIQKQLNDINANNQNAKDTTNKKYGKNWLKKFEKETKLNLDFDITYLLFFKT